VIEVIITDEMLVEARRKATEMGQLKGSMMKGDRNIIGFLGEIATQSIIGGDFHNTYDYDIMTPSGKTVDVKTKKINYPPKDYYACNIFTANEKQACDYLVFAFVHTNLEKAWVAGYYGKKDFLKDCDFIPKGHVADNGLKFKRDNFEMKVSQLKPSSQLVAEFGKAAA
jgi:hypothetical protein